MSYVGSVSTYDVKRRTQIAEARLDQLDGLLRRLYAHPEIHRLREHPTAGVELLAVMDEMRTSAAAFRVELSRSREQPQPASEPLYTEWLDVAIDALCRGVQQCTDLLQLLHTEMEHDVEASRVLH